MVVTGCQENKSCSKVLNFLERLDDRIRCTHEETVAVVKPQVQNFLKRLDDRIRCTHEETVAVVKP